MKLRNRALGQLGAALAVCSLAAACTQQRAPEPTPSPPPASSTPAETELERQTRLAFEEGEKVYRINTTELARVLGKGGTKKVTKVLSDTSAEDYLAFLDAGFEAALESGWHTDRPAVITALLPGSYKGTQLTITSCEDYREVHLVYPDGRVVRPAGTRLYVQTLTLKRFGKQWKVTNLKSDEVKSLAKEARCTGEST